MKKIENIVVANIITTGQIVINKGLKDGIYDSMEFVVYELGPEIFDPLSNKSLGTLEKPKGKFRVLSIQSQITTLISKKNVNRTAGATLGLINAIKMPDDDEVVLLKSIKVGDKVKIINEY